MDFHEININGAERNIFRDCVEEIRMGGNPEKLKKLEHITVYRREEYEEDEDKVEGKVLGYGGTDVSILPVVYPRGAVSDSSLRSFLSVDSSYKPSHTSLPVSIVKLHIQEYFKNKRGRKQKFIKPQ